MFSVFTNVSDEPGRRTRYPGNPVTHVVTPYGERDRPTGSRLPVAGQDLDSRCGLENFIDRVPWSEDVTQHAKLADFDLGVAPVPDEPYTRGGKGGYKLLQYAAAATPAVAGHVAVNRWEEAVGIAGSPES
jgi:hypothetical protein